MDWKISEKDLREMHPDVYSTIFCIGNGRLTTRGTFSDEGPSAFKGTYLAGLYTRAGYGLVYPLVSPDWLFTEYVESGKKIDSIENHRTLDMKSGVLSCTGRINTESTDISISEERFASFANPNVVCQKITLSIKKCKDTLVVKSGINGDVRNHRAKYYKPGQFPNSTEEGLKLSVIDSLLADKNKLQVVLYSPQKGNRVGAHAFVNIKSTGNVEVKTDGKSAFSQFIIDQSCEGKVIIVEKICSIAADLPNYENCLDRLVEVAGQIEKSSFTELYNEHYKIISEFWEKADVQIEGDEKSQLAVRYAIWSTRIAAPLDNGASSIGAKNLTGDWYRGAVFWDMEIFQLPMLCAIAPEQAKNHLLYRINRLGSAKVLASQDGYDGARFPWQSYDTGLEDPPVIGGFLYQQIHLNAAVAWGVLQYYKFTRDDSLLLEGGLELLLELCKFWNSRLTLRNGKYSILNVCGPDEVHQGVNDNTYTNVMVQHILKETVKLVEKLGKQAKEIIQKCSLDEKVFDSWKIILEKITIPYIQDGIPAQFEGFEKYPEPNQKLLDTKGHGQDNTNKQADTLLLFQTIPDLWNDELLQNCWDYYAPLCTQTSSLSLCTHALLAARLGLSKDAQRFLSSAIRVDLDDGMGNTCHGIHGAGEGGIWLATVQGFGGLRMKSTGLHIEPCLPPFWKALSYQFMYENQLFTVKIHKDEFFIVNKGDKPVDIIIDESKITFEPGKEKKFKTTFGWKSQELSAVIFDLDGVLVTTDTFHYLAWKSLADELGMQFDEKVNHRLRGVSRENSLKIIYEHNNRSLPDETEFNRQCTLKNDRYVELIGKMTSADILPGALELLKELRAAGIKTAIASASKNTPLVLERTGLDKWIDAVSDGNNISSSKPDPQVFFIAAQRCRCLPWNCIGVEDAASGVESIQRAGMVAIGIGDSAKSAEYRVDIIKELTLAKVLEAFKKFENKTDPYYERNVLKMKMEMG